MIFAMSADICVFFEALKAFPVLNWYTLELVYKWIINISFLQGMQVII